MKPLIRFLLLLFTITEEISACQKHLIKTEVMDEDRDYMADYYDYEEENTKSIIESATITCTNISSLSEIPHYHFVHEEYDQYLNITKSNVSTIPSSAFAGFHLTKLSLSQIHIKDILPEAFNNLSRLQELYLNNNELTELSNGVFNHLQHLKILDLNNNKIHQIGSLVFADLDNLARLYLRNNQLSKFDDNWLKTLKHLKVLDLTGNPLKTIPQHLYGLEDLILAEVSVSQFSVNLSQSNLKLLNLSLNHLSVIDLSLFPEECSLFLAHNKISSLENLQMLNVSHLHLEDNDISTIKGTFKNVKELNLAHNKLEFLEIFFFNKSDMLEILNLSFNRISIIRNDTFLGLSSLANLNLGHNNINRIDMGLFRDLAVLKILDLSYNKIDKFQFGTFDSLKNLEVLDISNNKLVDLHQYTFNSLKQLTDLRFDSNQISSFDVSFLNEHLQNLRLVSLNRNPWNCNDLVKIEKKFLDHGTYIEWGDTFDVENFHGITCINRNEFDENSKIIRMLENIKQQPIQINNNKMLSVGIVIQILISSSLLVVVFLIFVILRDKLRPTRDKSELLSEMVF